MYSYWCTHRVYSYYILPSAKFQRRIITNVRMHVNILRTPPHKWYLTQSLKNQGLFDDSIINSNFLFSFNTITVGRINFSLLFTLRLVCKRVWMDWVNSLLGLWITWSIVRGRACELEYFPDTKGDGTLVRRLRAKEPKQIVSSVHVRTSYCAKFPKIKFKEVSNEPQNLFVLSFLRSIWFVQGFRSKCWRISFHEAKLSAHPCVLTECRCMNAI